MEGRIALTLAPKEFEQLLGSIDKHELQKHFKEAQYNLAPSNLLPVITNLQHQQLRFFKWGLIPSWTNSSKNAKGLLNISTSALKDKPVLQKALANKRCLIWANGFYLWKDSPAGKIPYYVRLKSHKPFVLAGLWESWDEEDALNTCCLITRKPSSSLSYFPTEIPLVLTLEEGNAWLMEKPSKDHLLEEGLFIPEAEFEFYPVNRKIIKSYDNDPKFVQKISYVVAEQTKLF